MGITIINYLLSWILCHFKCIWMYNSPCNSAYVSNIKGVMKYEILRVPNFKSIFVAWGGPTFTTYTIERRKNYLIPTYMYYPWFDFDRNIRSIYIFRNTKNHFGIFPYIVLSINTIKLQSISIYLKIIGILNGTGYCFLTCLTYLYLVVGDFVLPCILSHTNFAAQWNHAYILCHISNLTT